MFTSSLRSAGPNLLHIWFWIQKILAKQIEGLAEGVANILKKLTELKKLLQKNSTSLSNHYFHVPVGAYRPVRLLKSEQYTSRH